MRRFLALACLLMLVGAACGKTKDTGFPEPSPTSTSTEHVEEGGPITGPIDIADSEFKPKTGTVKPGTTVTWNQSGSAPHSVTFDDDSFDSSPDCPPAEKCTQAGAEVTFEFKKAGTFAYFCKIHGTKGGTGMAGEITVA